MVAKHARLHFLMSATAGAGPFPPAIAPRVSQTVPQTLAQPGGRRRFAQRQEQLVHLDQLADRHHLPLHVVEQLLVRNLLRLAFLMRRQVGTHDLHALYNSRQNENWNSIAFGCVPIRCFSENTSVTW